MALLAEFRRCAVSWWCQDRVRVAPREGRWLRLQPGAVVFLEGVAVLVRSRREHLLQRSVVYELDSDPAPCALRVRVGGDVGDVCLKLLRGGRWRVVAEPEVSMG